MIQTLRIAIYDLGKDSFLGNLFYLEAPASQNELYGVISELPSVEDQDSDNEFKFENVQINGYSDSLTELETAMESLKSVLDGKQESFDLTDWYVIDIELVLTRSTKIDVKPNGIFQTTHQYRVHLQKK